MAVIAADLSGKPVIGSGLIVSPGKGAVFLYPFENDRDYKIRITSDFGDQFNPIPTIYGTPGQEFFDVAIKRKWKDGIAGSFTELLIAEGDEENLYLNLVFNIIGSEYHYNMLYLYTIYQDKPEQSR